MKKRIISIIFALALTLSVFAPAMAANSFNNDVKNSVVYIEVDYYDENGQLAGERGTGFFIGKSGEAPQYIITNYHVIENRDRANGQILVAFDQNTVEPAYYVDGKYDGTLDIAVLRLDKPTTLRKPLKLIKPSADLVGSNVYAVGYPVISDLIGSYSRFGTDDVTVTSGTLSRISTDAYSGARFVQHDATISGGNSGGPLVTPEGYVLGVNTYSTDSSTYFSLSTEEIIDLLSSNNIKYTMANEINWMLIGIIAAAAVVIILIVVVIVLAVRKKSTKINPPVMPVAPEAPAPSRYVHSCAPQHGGRRIKINSMPVLIGRDASCDLAFDRSTPGVSKRHCQVVFDAQSNVFVLTDLNSSYGTFLANGTRLTPNMPYRLQSGDSFYLGSADNTLRLETE